MSNEKQMRKEKVEKRKVKITPRQVKRKVTPYLLAFLFSLSSFLILLSCQDPSMPSQAENFPPGKGSFSLSVAVARTILPTLDESKFVSYTLDFQPSSGSMVRTERVHADLGDPVYLEPGTYNLVVTAYLDSGMTEIAARGSMAGLVINEGVNTNHDITLRAIIGEGSGTFTYDVSFPAGLATAGVTIAKVNNTTSSHEKSFLSGGSGTTAYTETVPLDAGYYDVVFTFEKADGQTLIWRELLHVYPNLESIFDMEFKDGDFYQTKYTVTLVLNNEVTQNLPDVQHGATVDRPLNPTNPNSELAFDNWYSNNGLTALFDFETPIMGNTIVYAGWKLANLTSTTDHILGWISAGTFTMGSPTSEPGRFDDETQREVTLTQGFYMGKYQVTQAQYQAVMGSNPSNYKTPVSPETSTGNRPVEQVSWYDTLVFCNRLSMNEGLEPAYRIKGSTDPSAWGDVPRWTDGETAVWDAVQIVAGSTGYRLPTEAQWEYACRARTVAAYNWGTDYIDDSKANYNASILDANNTVEGTSLNRTTGVGSYAPNAWGLYDMHGNVSEFCWDWYGSYSGGAQTDPTGAVSGDARVRRGGAKGSGRYLRSAYRDSMIPYGVNLSTGFRIMRP